MGVDLDLIATLTELLGVSSKPPSYEFPKEDLVLGG